MNHAPLPRSAPGHGFTLRDAVAPNQPVSLTLVLRPKCARGELAAHLGRCGFQIDEAESDPTHLVVHGKAAGAGDAFGVELARFGHHHSHSGAVHLPEGLTGSVIQVLGLDTRPMARRSTNVDGAGQYTYRYTVPELTKRYAFPADFDGSGTRIAILVLGAGLRTEDLKVYFDHLKLPAPTVNLIEIGDATNAPAPKHALRSFLLYTGVGRRGAPGDPQQRSKVAAVAPTEDLLWTWEAAMDVQIAGAAAPGATIDVYLTTSDSRGIYEAVRKAAASGAAAISCSFGQAESTAEVAYRDAVERAFEDAGKAGATVCVGSGDSGSAPDGKSLDPFYPATSPHALACGGTRSDGSEAVWNEDDFGFIGATGGGYSKVFDRPDWQRAAGLMPGGKRAVPDVAANAAASTGCWLWVGGLNSVSMGTSAAAPLWAALCARLTQATGAPLGPLARRLYATDIAETMRAVTEGNNRWKTTRSEYCAGKGWDACTGLGAPNGAALLEALRK